MGEAAEKRERTKGLNNGPRKALLIGNWSSPRVFYDEKGNCKQNPGFDAVIGNPPYYLLQGTELQTIVRWLDSDIYSGLNDVSHFFLKRACQRTRLGGMFAFIITRYWLEAHFANSLRQFLAQNAHPVILVDFGNLQVWTEVNVLTIIAIFTKGHPSNNTLVYAAETSNEKSADVFLKNCIKIPSYCRYEVPSEVFSAGAWHLRALGGSAVWKKVVMQSVTVGTICDNTQGIKTGNNAAFTVNEQTVTEKHLERNWLLPLAQAEYVQRYELLPTNEYVIYSDGSKDIKDAPNIMSHLLPYKPELGQRAECKDGLYPWWRLQRPRDPNLIRSDKRILVPLYATHNRFFATPEPYVGMTDIYILVPTDEDYSCTFLGAVLNSGLLDSYHRAFCKVKRAGYLEYSGAALSNLPIRRICFGIPKKEREQLLEKGKELYQEYIENQSWSKVLALVTECLPQKTDGVPDTEQEKSDVVHDLLAFLAEEMTRLNNEKQSIIKAFLSWLEKEILKGSVEDQKNKAAIKDFHENNFEALLNILKNNKTVPNPCPSILRDAIEKEFNATMSKLAPLKAYIKATDDLINRMVYRLYGLTDLEIATVEGQLNHN